MMMPRIFGENLFDDFMNDFTFPAFPNVEKKLASAYDSATAATQIRSTALSRTPPSRERAAAESRR